MASNFLELPNGNEIKPEITKLTWEFEKADKGTYPHFFIKEIHEEPKVIKNIALNGVPNARKFADLIRDAFGTFLIACGSASYAAIGATHFFSKNCQETCQFCRRI